LSAGRVRFPEIGKVMSDGEVFGEGGLFAPQKRPNVTAESRLGGLAAERRSACGVQHGSKSDEVGGAEDHAISGRDIHEIEVNSARAILRLRSAGTPGRSLTSTTATLRSQGTARWEMPSRCRSR
jgi:hypothetical protein